MLARRNSNPKENDELNVLVRFASKEIRKELTEADKTAPVAEGSTGFLRHV